MKQIIFYFKSNIYPNCICTTFPVHQAETRQTPNAFQFTVMPEPLFIKHSQTNDQYIYQDITGLHLNPEEQILNYGLHSFLSNLAPIKN